MHTCRITLNRPSLRMSEQRERELIGALEASGTTVFINSMQIDVVCEITQILAVRAVLAEYSVF